MGRFDGVLLAVDYDDTLMPFGHTALSDGNRRAIARFQAEGGLFTISTGRDLHSFRGIREALILNAPVVLSNGAVIFSTKTDRILYQDTLPLDFRTDLQHIMERFPEIGVEVHRDFDIYVVRNNTGVEEHLTRMGGVGIPTPLEKLPKACTKIALIAPQCYGETKTSLAVSAYVQEHWLEKYDMALSGGILDVNRRGTNKGTGVLELCRLLHIDRRHLYCVGDNWNDLPMLQAAAAGFVPASARPEVRNAEGMHQVRACADDAVAHVIERLTAWYEGGVNRLHQRDPENR